MRKPEWTWKRMMVEPLNSMPALRMVNWIYTAEREAHMNRYLMTAIHGELGEQKYFRNLSKVRCGADAKVLPVICPVQRWYMHWRSFLKGIWQCLQLEKGSITASCYRCYGEEIIKTDRIDGMAVRSNQTIHSTAIDAKFSRGWIFPMLL